MQSSALKPTYTDFSGLNEMRAQARVDPQASLKQVAKQFEGIFVQMMLKSMRDASMGDPIFDSDQSKLYRDMFDKQVALDMSNTKGIGLADSLVRQLGRNDAGKMLPPSTSGLQAVGNASVKKISPSELATSKSVPDKTQFKTHEEFTNHILPYAEKAASELGVSPLALVSQAALETAWGKSLIHHQDGSNSFNLFNLKVDKSWHGEHVVKSTLEYNNGQAKHEKAAFRAYDSYSDSFDDYTDFLRTNTRYGTALHNKGDEKLFIQELHQADYATDPNYADKILGILNDDSIQRHAKSKIDVGSV